MTDVIIIGAGTAGLSAAIYALRSGKKIIIIEEKNYGGQIINARNIENYPGIKRISGYDFATQLYEQAEAMGATIIYEKVLRIIEDNKVKIVKTDAGEYRSKSVIIATGSKTRKLGIDREKELTGAGVSYCATCDGAFFRGKDVIVVGGGNTALADALVLSEYCSKVYIIHRRSEFRGEDTTLEKIRARENIELVINSSVIRLNGDTSLESVTIKENVTGSESTIKAEGLFVAIGYEPDNDIFKDIVKLDDYGYIVAGEDCKTSANGIYAAGDCRTKIVRQLTTAAADGAIAALAASENSEI